MVFHFTMPFCLKVFDRYLLVCLGSRTFSTLLNGAQSYIPGCCMAGLLHDNPICWSYHDQEMRQLLIAIFDIFYAG